MEDAEIAELIKDIRSRFPEVSDRMDAWIEFQGFDQKDDNSYTEMESFSQTATDAIKRKDSDKVKVYMDYVSGRYKAGSDNVKKFIDVYFVESLMWDIKNRKLLKHGWTLIPPELKKLYIDLWEAEPWLLL